MDHLGVLRDKIGRFREEIADILELNDEFRRAVRNGAVAQVAHGRRHERLQAIQRELVQLADLGRLRAEWLAEFAAPHFGSVQRSP